MDHFILPKDDNTRIFRVFKIDHLRSWLGKSELYFPRPQFWDDPFENILLKQRYHRACTSVELSFGDVLDRYFGQCWTNLEGETDATWRIYAPNADGVRVGTSVKKIYAALSKAFGESLASDFVVCRVDYFPADQIQKRARLLMEGQQALRDGGEGCLSMLTVKRPEFAHESEVRVIFHDKTNRVAATDKFVLVPVKPSEVIESVTIDPRLDTNTAGDLIKEFEAMLPGVEIGQSLLYHLDAPDVPVYQF